ncbi:MAG TPA: glycerol-3-phosphate dehydrogenase [Candidatus Pelagibacter sp.]|jgi:glycerol-3-phosphate dehydrogenase subunit C|nr:glycerol-3-phosphate dehydrogenase [Candidatus Pelagibacter sp.]
MNKEGSTQAPTRHNIDFNHPDFLDQKKLDDEMRRVFDICHGCRRCFNLCDSFPKLFEMIDDSKDENVESLSSNQFDPVVNSCTLCDMCFMTKCPYVPPHEFDLDFPHLMLRYRALQKKQNKLPSIPKQLAQIDRNAKIGVTFSWFVNWVSNIKNKFLRKILELFFGIDKKVELPVYNSETFTNYFKNNNNLINIEASKKNRKVVIYSTCFVNFNKKSTGIAALKVLKKNGVEVQEAYPGCCGMPFLEQADLAKIVEQAKKVSKDLLEWVDKGYQVITLTASCGLMLKFEWALLLPEDKNIKRLSKNVSDIDEYIVDISNKEGLASGLKEIDGGVTIHNACHARAQNMGIKARDMLKLIPNIKIDVVEKCAGHGGTFGVMKETHNLALKIGRPTARQIKNKNNKYMASDCPLAGKHLKQLEQDTKISSDEALHPIELLAKSYKLKL